MDELKIDTRLFCMQIIATAALYLHIINHAKHICKSTRIKQNENRNYKFEFRDVI